MMVTSKNKVKKVLENSSGEKIYELIGKAKELGGSSKHSVAYVVIKKNGSSLLHYHPKAEESYYVLKGKARIVVDNNENLLKKGDAVLIMPFEKHQIFNDGEENLEFIVVSAPAWEPNNSVFINKKKRSD